MARVLLVILPILITWATISQAQNATASNITTYGNDRVGWMGLVFMAPEVGVATAANQYMEDKNALEKLRGGWTDEMIYSFAHVLYANMGGFLVAVPKDEAIVRAKGQFLAQGDPIADFQPLHRKSLILRSLYLESKNLIFSASLCPIWVSRPPGSLKSSRLVKIPISLRLHLASWPSVSSLLDIPVLEKRVIF
jgi:hypothetical protein